MSADTRIVGTTPAKLNLGLEVVARRPDGYHEVVTILQAINVVDHFIYEPSESGFEYLGPASVEASDDMVRDVFERADNRDRWSGRLRLEKGIPIAAGLGGGSSDAAFALRVIHPKRPHRDIEAIAASLGSDVPFFVEGGTALATGTGTRLTPLPTPELWFVLVVPRVSIASKTARLYAGLQASDFSSGQRVLKAAEAVKRGDELQMPLPNAFTRQMRAVPEVEHAWDALRDAGGQAIMLSGAGPTIFAPVTNADRARDIVSGVPESAGIVTIAGSIPVHRADPLPGRLHVALTGGRRGH